MTAFRTVDDLRASLEREGLSFTSDQVVATARPCILFLRKQAKDDGLPAGASKMGGFPDLPEGFAWPERPPYPDAEKRAAQVMEFARGVARDRQKLVDGPIEKYQRRFSQAEVDAVVPSFEGKAKLFGAAFPMSFVAQLDLATLSREPGFDLDLPKTGVLSIFEDVTAEGMAGVRVAYWHDGPADTLRRTPPPAALVDYFDRHSGYGFGAGEAPWSTLTLAETLEPQSAVSVPHHWKYAYPQGSAPWTKVWDWFRSETAGVFTPSAHDERGGDLSVGYFGDQLGGWPDDIQGNPESEIDGARFVIKPGQTPWRHLFSYGGEFYGGTRLMGSDGKGDGATYLLIRKEDLAARRFEAVRWVYDQT